MVWGSDGPSPDDAVLAQRLAVLLSHPPPAPSTLFSHTHTRTCPISCRCTARSISPTTTRTSSARATCRPSTSSPVTTRTRRTAARTKRRRCALRCGGWSRPDMQAGRQACESVFAACLPSVGGDEPVCPRCGHEGLAGTYMREFYFPVSPIVCIVGAWLLVHNRSPFGPGAGWLHAASRRLPVLRGINASPGGGCVSWTELPPFRCDHPIAVLLGSTRTGAAFVTLCVFDLAAIPPLSACPPWDSGV